MIRHEEKDYALFVNAITDADIGVYEVRAKNSEGDCSATAELTISSKWGFQIHFTVEPFIYDQLWLQ